MKNPMDRGAWQATSYEVRKSQTQLRDRMTTMTTTIRVIAESLYPLLAFSCFHFYILFL